MKIALISDVHGNLEALTEVIKSLESHNPDKIIFLGDVVGYGAEPNECCELLRRITDVNIMGNHDAATIDRTEIQWFSENARVAIEFHKKILKDENKEWLKTFVSTYTINDIVFCHGSPIDPENYDYVVDPIRASFIMSWLASEGAKVSVVGHAHQVVVFHAPMVDSAYPERTFPEKVNLEEDNFYVINVGSVGQPRDGDPRAAYGIIDFKKKTYELHRVEYDVEQAASKIKRAGMPDFLWQRLYRGI